MKCYRIKNPIKSKQIKSAKNRIANTDKVCQSNVLCWIQSISFYWILINEKTDLLMYILRTVSNSKKITSITISTVRMIRSRFTFAWIAACLLCCFVLFCLLFDWKDFQSIVTFLLLFLQLVKGCVLWELIRSNWSVNVKYSFNV